MNSTWLLKTKTLDDAVYHYYHENKAKSGIVYFKEKKIELLEKNKLIKKFDFTGFSIAIAIIKEWIFE